MCNVLCTVRENKGRPSQPGWLSGLEMESSENNSAIKGVELYSLNTLKGKHVLFSELMATSSSSSRSMSSYYSVSHTTSMPMALCRPAEINTLPLAHHT